MTETSLRIEARVTLTHGERSIAKEVSLVFDGPNDLTPDEMIRVTRECATLAHAGSTDPNLESEG